MKFAQNPSKTRFSVAADQPGFGCFGQQWVELVKKGNGENLLANEDEIFTRLNG
jgi:hypothetical protein